MGDPAVRKRAWQTRLGMAAHEKVPNAGHRVLVELERRGKLHALVTQDVDGLHPFNAGLLVVGRKGLRPCTPSGCIKMLEHVGCDPKGKRALVLGRSTLVGKPIALMLLEKHATVTIAHSRTENLADRVREADIVIAAVGRPNLVKGDWIQDGAVVIDVGINRLEDGTLTGDVDFAGAEERAAYITPVPGGVGPMTIAMLLSNTVDAAEARIL
jgi:methylenetetrahydrofolate dehydrogenase (NADP+)/methenyltetrahydrofolate cyclohydrolase